MRNKKVYMMTQIAIFSALSFGLYFVKFPLPFMFPSFLDIQFSNLPAILAGFITGPLGGITVVIIRMLLKLPFSSTLYVGEIADLLIGLATVLTSSLIYKKYHNKKGGAKALLFGSIAWILTAVIANALILVPFYIQVMFGGNVQSFVNLCSIIPGIDSTNYLWMYLLVTVLPFNALLSILVSLITFVVYKRTSILFDKMYKGPVDNESK